jgi:hypothetical protein
MRKKLEEPHRSDSYSWSLFPASKQSSLLYSVMSNSWASYVSSPHLEVQRRTWDMGRTSSYTTFYFSCINHRRTFFRITDDSLLLIHGPAVCAQRGLTPLLRPALWLVCIAFAVLGYPLYLLLSNPSNPTNHTPVSSITRHKRTSDSDWRRSIEMEGLEVGSCSAGLFRVSGGTL